MSSGIPTSVGAITLFVRDRARAREFYARAFDLEPVHEDADSAAFDFGGLIVNLLALGAARELIEPAAVADGDAGSRLQLTLTVADAGAACAELATRGVELLNGPLDRPWGLRTAAFADPDGHVWELAQPYSAPS